MQDTKRKTLDQFITEHGITFEQRPVNTRPDGLMSDNEQGIRNRMYHFKLRIKCGKRAFGLYFSQGAGIDHVPELKDVLDCLASDASSYENADGFEGWAEDFGYEQDSRKAERMYRAIGRQAEQLKRTIGAEAYDELLWNTERL